MNVCTQIVLFLGLMFSVSAAHAQNVHGVLRVVKGDVQIKSAKTGETGKARLGAQVYPKDTIITGKDSRAKIVMVDNNEINVSPESQIEIQHYEFDPNAGKKEVLLNVIYGKVRSKVEQKYDGKTTKFQIKTPSAVAGVRGTDFLTSFNRSDRTSQITTFQGKVEFGVPGPNGSIANPVFVGPGTQATSVAGAAPAPPAPVPKEQLAKMDNDTKAETAPAKSDASGDQRQPAGDKEKKDDKDKKDDSAKKDDGGGKKDGAGPKKDEGGGKKDDAPAAKKDDAGAKRDGGPRGPASAGGDSMFKREDTDVKPVNVGPTNPGPTVLLPPVNITPTTSTDDHIRDAIQQNGPSKVLIRVRQQ